MRLHISHYYFLIKETRKCEKLTFHLLVPFQQKCYSWKEVFFNPKCMWKKWISQVTWWIQKQLKFISLFLQFAISHLEKGKWIGAASTFYQTHPSIYLYFIFWIPYRFVPNNVMLKTQTTKNRSYFIIT